MNQQQKDDILHISKGIHNEKLFFFEQIPSDKLENARESYASFTSEEDVILLYDDTVFGSAKDGFLLTSRRLYQKNMTELSRAVKLSNIEDITIKHRMLSSLMSVHSDEGIINIILTESSNGKNDKLLAVLKQIIQVLQSPGEAGRNTQVTQCRGCGAGFLPDQLFCEYCGGAL